jgi:hypothetical protein
MVNENSPIGEEPLPPRNSPAASMDVARWPVDGAHRLGLDAAEYRIACVPLDAREATLETS